MGVPFPMSQLLSCYRFVLLCCVYVMTLTAFSTSTLSAVERSFSSSPLSVQPHIPWVNADAYTPIVLHIKSASACDLRVWTEHASSTASAIFSIPAERKVIKTLLFPGQRNMYNVTIHWSSSNGQTGSQSISRDMDYRDTHVCIVDRDNSIGDNAIFKGLSGSSSYGSADYKDINSNRLPSAWQGYPQWLYVVLTPLADSALTPQQIDALRTWQLCGGHFCATTPALQKKWLQRGVTIPLLHDESNHAFIRTVKHLEKTHATAVPYQVPGTEKAPTTVFMIVLLLFLILVGPVNYMWVRRRKELSLFLFTTPVLSAGFCVLLFIAGIAADGLGSHRSTLELTWLDMKQHQAATWHSLSWFSGLSGGDFTINNKSVATVTDAQRHGRHRLNDPRPAALALTWSHQQTLTGDWLPSRSHQQLQFCTPHSEQRRLFVYTDASGALCVHNGLGSTITHFEYYNAQQRLFTASQIGSGQHMTLTARPIGDENVDKAKGTSQLVRISHNDIARFTADTHTLWTQSGAHFFRAQLAAPLTDVPGPEATDAEAARAYICGIVDEGVAP